MDHPPEISWEKKHHKLDKQRIGLGAPNVTWQPGKRSDRVDRLLKCIAYINAYHSIQHVGMSNIVLLHSIYIIYLYDIIIYMYQLL